MWEYLISLGRNFGFGSKSLEINFLVKEKTCLFLAPGEFRV